MEINLAGLGKPIALGRTAEIYAWREGQVLKLFRDWVPAGAVEYEARIARAVQKTGFRAPAAGEVVEVGGRLGLVYERVDGPTLASSLHKRPWTLSRAACLLAQLHAEMHAHSAPGLPSLRERLRAKLQAAEPLPDDLKEGAVNALERLPDGDRLCHGDFHPENVLLTPGGPIIIDWVDAARGHALADVARSYILIAGGSLPPRKVAAWIDGWGRKRLVNAYLKQYFALRPEDQDRLSRWIPVIAAARLSEGIAEEESTLMAVAREVR